MTSDPIHDYNIWLTEQERKKDELYTCSWCGEKIQDESFWEICDEKYCDQCAERLFRKSNLKV